MSNYSCDTLLLLSCYRTEHTQPIQVHTQYIVNLKLKCISYVKKIDKFYSFMIKQQIKYLPKTEHY